MLNTIKKAGILSAIVVGYWLVEKYGHHLGSVLNWLVAHKPATLII